MISGRGAVSRVINACVSCRKLRGPLLEQKIADLPEDQCAENPSFTNIGLDIFGPFEISQRRSTDTRRTKTGAKHWCLLFTYSASRAVHIGILEAVDTSNFIDALCRFVCLRGLINIIQSDNGSNMMRARHELELPDSIEVERAFTTMECVWLHNQYTVLLHFRWSLEAYDWDYSSSLGGHASTESTVDSRRSGNLLRRCYEHHQFAFPVSHLGTRLRSVTAVSKHYLDREVGIGASTFWNVRPTGLVHKESYTTYNSALKELHPVCVGPWP